MPFPWRRYLRSAGIVFVISIVVSLILAAALHAGQLDALTVAVAVTDSVVLAVIAAFPLTVSARRGPRG